MSDSDSNDTVIPDKVLPLTSIIHTLSRTLNAEVDEDNAEYDSDASCTPFTTNNELEPSNEDS